MSPGKKDVGEEDVGDDVGADDLGDDDVGDDVAEADDADSPPRPAQKGRTAADVPLPGGSFTLFVQKLAYQALITLGVVENPLTRRREPNLPHAQTVIDDLMMLREKTRGNLAPDEERHLTQVVGDLQRHFVQLKQSGVRGSG